MSDADDLKTLAQARLPTILAEESDRAETDYPKVLDLLTEAARCGELSMVLGSAQCGFDVRFSPHLKDKIQQNGFKVTVRGTDNSWIISWK